MRMTLPIKYLSVLLLFAYFSVGRAAQFIVDTLNDQVDTQLGDGLCTTVTGHCSLRAAIQESNVIQGPDDITLLPGTYLIDLVGLMEDSSTTGDFDILDNLSIIGAGIKQTVIDAQQNDRIFHLIDATLNLSHLTVINGQATDGGAINLTTDSELNLLQVALQNNHANNGGAIQNQGKITGNQVFFEANKATSLGSAINNLVASDNLVADTELQLTQCLFKDNQSDISTIISTHFGPNNELRIRNTLDQCSLVQNTSRFGIILNNAGATTTIINSTLSGNHADGVLFNDGFSEFIILNSTLTDNEASGVVDVHNNEQFVTISNSVLSGNRGFHARPNCSGKMNSEGGNYFGDLTGCEPTMHDSDTAGPDDAGLSPLFIGPHAWQHAYLPLKNSNLLDAGIKTFCSGVDLLGKQRPQDSDFDGMAVCTTGSSEIGDVIYFDGF